MKNTHLTSEERVAIQQGLFMQHSFKKIARTVGKSQTTISREVKKHSHTKGGEIRHKDTCQALKKAPFVCNPCKRCHVNCGFQKVMYYAKQAHDEYLKTLTEARVGINMGDEEFNKLDKIVSTGLKNGQHLYHILATNEVKQSVSTVYRYVNKNLLSAGKMDCPRIVKFKLRKPKPNEYIPKKLKSGRTYDDFCVYCAETNTVSLVEMDTVIGRIGGKCLLTLHFTDSNFMIARLLDNKTSLEVVDKLSAIKTKVPGLFSVILTDNGGEFSNVLEIEKGGTRLFFADPYQSSQKPRVEKNHTMFRDIVPSGSSFDNFTQETVDLIFSHINSVKRAHYDGKSAYEMFTFLHGVETATALGIVEIQPSEVVQSPKLLKSLRNN